VAGTVSAKVNLMIRVRELRSLALTAAGILMLPIVLDSCGGANPAAGGWKQIAELQGSDTISGNQFGSSVAISGSTAVVGSPHVAQSGAAYVFTSAGGGWQQTAEVKGADTVSFDQFGSSVAISGTTIVVGAADSYSQSGRAYVFTLSAGGWKQTAELKGSDTTAYDEFGSSVAVSGGTIVVGAGLHDLRTGSAYVFTLSAGGWKETAELKGSDTASYDDFGSAVAVSGHTIVVGAQYAAGVAGRAYVFTESAGGWKQTAELMGSDTMPQDYFGSAVATSGHTVVVGAYDHSAGAGRAYVFTESAGGWKQTAELEGSDTAAGDYFGSAVAVSGQTVAVAAEYHSNNAGRVYIFRGSSQSLTQTAELKGSDTAANDAFGASLGTSGGTIVVGAAGHAAKAGAMYAFEK